MESNLRNFISRFRKFTEEESEAFLSIFSPLSINKLDHIITEGTLVDTIYFINEGVLRGYYLKGGKQFTTNFYFGPTIVTDLASVRNDMPTRINIQALKTTRCLKASFADFEELIDTYPAIHDLMFKFLENLYLFGVTRQHSFIFDTPQERYIKLFSERPKVIAEIPQHYIASYLGIEPETLSRIRKRILCEK
ncbi:MAG: Crp/Fnr family transcriptional regulator [Flavobacterium sp.]